MLISCLSGKFWLFFVSQRLSLTAFLGSELAVALLGADFSLALKIYCLLSPSLPPTHRMSFGIFLGFTAESRAFLQCAVPLACSSFPFPHYKLLVFYGSITVDIQIQGNAKMGRE